jgi:hypothetical protein
MMICRFFISDVPLPVRNQTNAMTWLNENVTKKSPENIQAKLLRQMRFPAWDTHGMWS